MSRFGRKVIRRAMRRMVRRAARRRGFRRMVKKGRRVNPINKRPTDGGIMMT